jgi:hypothetical protein
MPRFIGGVLLLLCVLIFSAGGSAAPPVRACSDGIDNDGDALVDFPADPGCANAKDRDEFNEPEPPPPPPPPSGGNGDDLAFPIRGVFYYPWYAGNWFDKPGCNLSVAGTCASQHMPVQGYYAQSYAKARYDIDNMQRAGIELGISSWHGIGHRSDNAVDDMLRAAFDDGGEFEWAIYYELDAGTTDPSVTTLRSHLDYLRTNYASHPNYLWKGGKPVIFVYNTAGDCEDLSRWSQASAGQWYVVLKVFGGYLSCPNQPSSWHQYGFGLTGLGDRQPGFSFTIGPEFWHWSHASATIPRDMARFKSTIRAMVASGESWQLIISYNEWGEGTVIEPGTHRTQGFWGNQYLDALATNGN